MVKEKLDERLTDVARQEDIKINDMIVALMEFGLSQWPKPDVKKVVAKYRSK